MSRSRWLSHVALAGSLGCGTAALPREQQRPAPVAAQEAALLVSAQDTALLTAIVRAVRSEAGPLRLFVDPRPLRPDSQLFEVTRAKFGRTSPEVLQAREAALRNMHVEPGDAVALGGNARCPGIFVLPERPGHNPHAQCPGERRYVVAVGLPRPGMGRLPNGGVYDRDRMLAAEGYSAVRVVRTIVTPEGSSLAYYDYVMQKQAGGWKFVQAAGLLHVE